MKKTIASALVTALAVGAASTTFAAANPFSDVPSDHWAYDAVTTLAHDGVIEGYGDTTFKGGQNITRYEMAQMVAKAMAKQDVSAADKALIDKLAAEFATELDSLGVRVANLERNADKVKFTGKLRWQYDSERYKHNHPWNKAADKTTYRDDSNGNYVMFRLTPTARINDHWQVRARIDAKDFTNSDSTGTPTLKRAWVVGNYGNTRIQIGKFHPYVDTELIMDNVISGAQVSFGRRYSRRLRRLAASISTMPGRTCTLWPRSRRTTTCRTISPCPLITTTRRISSSRRRTIITTPACSIRIASAIRMPVIHRSLMMRTSSASGAITALRSSGV
ncbi:S-layer homology domain-containing protein [uncultured Mitsuokella sp.]|uniref:S-layer homology domain-containing protein n=1 Tax=uncultured Mitsuokella sp. TaxID=453120 RepID=UPI00260C6BAD|nr:S-layer homology domain-containing protein [uncultured Mitsuokella sp.]